MKKLLCYSSVAVVLLGLFSSANAQKRMDRLCWTDRGQSNPPLTHPGSLDSTIENFWNVALAEVSPARPQVRQGNTSATGARTGSLPSTEVQQDRSSRERRGYIGINLFNVIPLIDFVHGDVTTESSDHVKGRK